MYTRGVDRESDVERMAVDLVRRMFARNRELSAYPVDRELSDEGLAAVRRIGIPETGRPLAEVMDQFERDILSFGLNTDHERFLAYVPAPFSTFSWLGDIAVTAYNRHAGSFANYPAGCMVEHELLSWFCGKAGFSAGAGGSFVPGGSIANLTAFVAARAEKLAPEELLQGVAYVSEQAHSSNVKGLRIIGVDDSRIRVIPCDGRQRMVADRLEEAVREDEARGLKPFLVVGTAGATNTAAVDPLPELARICREHGLWLHVDGAFGASVLLTRYRGMLAGVELADSLSWDAHKWLFQTYGCAMVLVRDERTLTRAFSLVPEYLRDAEDAAKITNPSNMSPELSHPARGLRLWFTLQAMGEQGVAAAIEHGFDLARWTQDEAEKNPRIEIVTPAQMSVVNFRYTAPGLSEDELDELNAAVSRRVLAGGYAGIYTTEIDGKRVLRICAMHPETSEADMRGVVRTLNECCEAELRERGM